MMENATDLETTRAVRLSALEEEEKVALENENLKKRERAGLGDRAGFMKEMQNHMLNESRIGTVK
jgi:hypothetical protein